MKCLRSSILPAFVLAATSAWGAGGVAELRLDAAAVAEVLGAALPGPTQIEVAGLGELTLEVGPVRRVEFERGAVLATVSVRIGSVGPEDVRLRLVPEIERTTGTAQLVAQQVRLARLPFDLDLSRFLPPAQLPRSVQWDLEMPGSRRLPVLCYVQGIEVERDRLRIDLGLVGASGQKRAESAGAR